MDAAAVLASLTLLVAGGFGAWALHFTLRRRSEPPGRAIPVLHMDETIRRRFDEWQTERDLFSEAADDMRSERVWR